MVGYKEYEKINIADSDESVPSETKELNGKV
jgi:hypothetical protein